MRVLILTPTALPSLTGNAITSERWRCALERHGITVKVVATLNLDQNQLLEEARLFQPDIIHGHHAFKTGRLLANRNGFAFFDSIPFVISCAGTDINQDLASEDKKETILEVCRQARTIITQSEGIAIKLQNHLNGFHKEIIYVPKSFMWLGDAPYNLREAAGCTDKDVLFFLPAGIRAVKGNLECLTAFREANRINPAIKILFAGPSLESDYELRFGHMLEHCGFASWIRSIPPKSMRAAYAGADVVLNTSFSEGFSNILLEAMASGKPIIASDIESNRCAITGNNGDKPAGLLYDPYNMDDFIKKILTLADSAKMRNALGQSGLVRVKQQPTPEVESACLMEIYRQSITK